MPSLSTDNLDVAIDQLARRMVAVQCGWPRMTKQALAGSDVLSKATNWMQDLHPTQRNILLGAGLGGAAGLGSSFFREKEDRQPLQSAITGALAGGAIGTGLSAYQAAGGKPQERPGQFQIGDRWFNLRPDTEITPERAARLRELQEKGKGTWAGWLSRTGTETLGRLGMSSPALTAGAGGGLYGLKQYMGPNWTPQSGPFKDKNIGKLLHQRWGLPGSMSSNIDHLQRGITDALSENTLGTSETTSDYYQPRKETREAGAKKKTSEWFDSLRRQTEKVKPSTSKIGIPLTATQQDALTRLQAYMRDNPEKAKQMVQSGKLKRLLSASGARGGIDETVLKSILGHGAGVSIPETAKGVRKAPSFRMSRANQIWDLLRGRGYVGGQSPFAKTVDMRTLGGKLRTGGKYAIPITALAAAAAMMHSGVSSARARGQLNREIRRLSTPAE